MKSINLFLLLVLGLSIISCGNDESTNTVEVPAGDNVQTEEQQKKAVIEQQRTSEIKERPKITEAVEAPAEHSKEMMGRANKTIAVQKWDANKETTEGVTNMIIIVKSVLKNGAGSSPLDAYRTIGKKLQQEMDTVFDKCTMKGEAHEKLHEFLLPVVDMIKVFQEKEVKDCDQTIHPLMEHLQGYFHIFNN